MEYTDAAARPHDADDDLPPIPGRDPRTIKVKLTTCETPPPLPIEDARPHDAEFVTRAHHEACIEAATVHLKRRVAELEAANAQLERNIDKMAQRMVDLLSGEARLAAALAASKAKLGEAQREAAEWERQAAEWEKDAKRCMELLGQYAARLGIIPVPT